MKTRLVESTFSRAEPNALAATPTELLAWAWDTFADRCCVLSSMQDATVIELALRVDRRFPIVFLDTGYHFDETWSTLRSVEHSYGVEVEVVGPITQPRTGVIPGECCDDKPTLLDRALDGRAAWVSGIRRAQTDDRRRAALVELDRRGLTKLNPIVQWSDEDHARFVEFSGVIQNPLLDKGYTSVGCKPCTSPPIDGDGTRSGRWPRSARTECGLHL